MSLPHRALLTEMLLCMSPVVAWFFSLKGLCWWETEWEICCEFLGFTPRIAPMGQQRLTNRVWVWDNGPLTEIHTGCSDVNPGCSCLSGVVSVTWFSLELEHSHVLSSLGEEILCGPSSLGQPWNPSLLQGCVGSFRLAGGHLAFLNLEELKDSPAKFPSASGACWKGAWVKLVLGTH